MKRVVRYRDPEVVTAASPITAADEDDISAEDFLNEGSGDDMDMGSDSGPVTEDELGDQLDTLADGVEDIQDQLDDVDEDEVSIEIDNNIDGALIAECDGCHGVFISAMRQSDQKVDHISGVCPLCNKETDQLLKWVVKKLDHNAQ